MRQKPIQCTMAMIVLSSFQTLRMLSYQAKSSYLRDKKALTVTKGNSKKKQLDCQLSPPIADIYELVSLNIIALFRTIFNLHVCVLLLCEFPMNIVKIQRKLAELIIQSWLSAMFVTTETSVISALCKH